MHACSHTHTEQADRCLSVLPLTIHTNSAFNGWCECSDASTALGHSRNIQRSSVGQFCGEETLENYFSSPSASRWERLQPLSLTITLVLSALPPPCHKQVACPSQQSHLPCTAVVMGSPSQAAFRFPALQLRPKTEAEAECRGKGLGEGKKKNLLRSNKCHCKHK